MRIALAQLNVTVGDLPGNANQILLAAQRAQAAGCELLLTPELALTGYPPQDLLFMPQFIADQRSWLYERLAVQLPIPALLGFVDQTRHEDKQDEVRGSLFNAAAFVSAGRVQAVVRKTLLPTYDVFDEWRYFAPAELGSNQPVELAGPRIGVTICEDLWDEGYSCKVVPQLKAAGAQALLNLSSSPWHLGKGSVRMELMRRHVREQGLPLFYCNLVGAQDELIFDGRSLVLDARGELIAQGLAFGPDLIVVDWDPQSGAVHLVKQEQAGGPAAESDSSPTAELFAGLTLGIRDYFSKCGFERAVLGLSGGIDSALTACLAVEALGPAAVIGVAMPSHYNASYSLDDARELAANLGIEFHVMEIEASVQLAMQRYRASFGDYNDPVTVENLQARERGKILMEISNDRRALVLSTGNKTEYALGYTTLYGDMCGGLAVIGDVDKMSVFELSRWYNELVHKRGGPAHCIPERTLTRPPSAELREAQVDPFDYPRISPLADLVIEQRPSRQELLARGYSQEEISRVLRMVRLSEYKRWQAPPILRVTEKAFGIGRRMPIVNHYPG